MKIVSTFPVVLDGEHNELITIKVWPTNTVHGLIYTLDGDTFSLPQGQLIKVALDKSKDKISPLTLACYFVGETQGLYDIEIYGSHGGDVVRHKVIQPSGGDAGIYTFSLIGGTKIPPP
jgi:hypothetical protein